MIVGELYDKTITYTYTYQ